jgi:hypothetical protein
MQDMILIVILIVTPPSSGPQCAELISKALNRQANLVTTIRQAISSVRSAEYRVIVMDEYLFEADPAAAAGVGELAEGALNVFLNFGIANSDRVIREVKAALRRREARRSDNTAQPEAPTPGRIEQRSDWNSGECTNCNEYS